MFKMWRVFAYNFNHSGFDSIARKYKIHRLFELPIKYDGLEYENTKNKLIKVTNDSDDKLKESINNY